MHPDKVGKWQLKEQLKNRVLTKFKSQFGSMPSEITLTPGRINLIGEHTDYNEGLAMPTAIDRWICVALSKSKNNISTIYSLNYNKCITIDPHHSFKGQDIWIQLAITALQVINDDFGITEGGNMIVNGNIPI